MHELEPEPPIVLCSQVGGAEHPPEREALLSQRVVRGQHALDALTPVLAAALLPPYVRLKLSRDARIKNVGKYESCMADTCATAALPAISTSSVGLPVARRSEII